MMVTIKICGLATPQAARAVAREGADMAGFIFFPKSPRHVTPQGAAELTRLLPGSVRTVAVCVDADDDALTRITEHLKPHILQAHGTESPARIRGIQQRFALPVIKSLPVAAPGDLNAITRYEGVADMLLFDARPPAQEASSLPGGNGLAFDWNLIAGMKLRIPWVLSGGLTPDNVGEAIRLTGASMVDVSSGVEEAPGCKSAVLVQQFIKAARAASGGKAGCS